MQYRPLFSHGPELSCLGFGSAAISGEGGGYGFGAMSTADAHNLIHLALDNGVNLFDTAPIYGFGLAEERLGQALKGQRERAFVISKSGVSWHSSKRVNLTNDPQVTAAMLDASLKRLQTDWIDLYMIHWPDPKVDTRFAMEVLARAQEKGQIRFIGLANTWREEIEKAQEIAPIQAVQNELNLFHSEEHSEKHSEKHSGETLALLPWLQKKKIGFIGHGTLAKGILTGRAKPGRHYDEWDARRRAPWFKKLPLEAMAAQAQKWRDTCQKEDLSIVQAALSFSLQSPGVTSCLCGGRSAEQWHQLLAASDNLLSEKQWERILKK